MSVSGKALTDLKLSKTMALKLMVSNMKTRMFLEYGLFGISLILTWSKSFKLSKKSGSDSHWCSTVVSKNRFSTKSVSNSFLDVLVISALIIISENINYMF